MAFKKVGTVCLFVEDQDRAKAFYTENLGFKLVKDQPLYPGAANRWLSVIPAEGVETEVILYKPDQNWQHYEGVVGHSQGITLEVDDIMNLVASLKAKGVEMIQEPDPNPWGTYAMVRDSEGNGIMLVEPGQGA